MTDYTSPSNVPGLGAVLTQAEHELPVLPALAVIPKREPVRTAEPDYAEAARFAGGLDAQQLNIALDFMFRLNDYDEDLDIIAGIRAARPEDLTAAETVVSGHLGTVKDFKSRALAKFDESEASSHVLKPSLVSQLGWWATLIAGFCVPAGAAYGLGLTSAGVVAAGSIGALALRMLSNPPQSQGVPPVVDSDWFRLRNDVVDAVLAGILTQRGVITEREGEALRRGFEHIRFIAHTTAAMATKPYSPPSLAVVAEAA